MTRGFSIPLQGLTAFSFWHLDNFSSSVSALSVVLDGGWTLTALPYYTNRAGTVSFQSDANEFPAFAEYTDRQAWHRYTLYLDPDLDLTWMRVTTVAGNVLGTSAALPIPAEAHSIQQVRIDARSSSCLGNHRAQHYGALEAGPATFTDPLPPRVVHVAVVGNADVSLSWDPPAPVGASPVAGYRLYRYRLGDEPSLVAELPGNRSYLDLGLAREWPYLDVYNYRLSSVDENGVESGLGRPMAAKLPNPPAAPTLAAAEPHPWEVRLQWSAQLDPHCETAACSPFLGYRIYRGADANHLSLLAIVEEGAARSFQDVTGERGTRYVYAVSAINHAGEGARSNGLTAGSGTPTEPRNITAKPSDHRVRIQWEVPSDPGSHPVIEYQIERVRADAPHVRQIFTVAPGGSLDDKTAENEITYLYRGRAKNAMGYGPWTETLTVRPALDRAPTVLTAVAGPLPSVTLTWREPATHDTPWGYKVYRSLDGVSWTHVASTPPKARFVYDTANLPSKVLEEDMGPLVATYTDTKVSPETTYRYRVSGTYGTAFGTVYEGPMSEAVTVTTPRKLP